MGEKSLLVELFVEELPPKVLRNLGQEFANQIVNTLVRCNLKLREPGWQPFASPRRLAVLIPDVAEHATDHRETVKLMPASVGLDVHGKATPALLKKLAALGIDASVIPELKRQGDGKTESLYFDSVVKGMSLVAGLQMALDEVLTRLPIPKVMAYQLADGWSSAHFVRPAHGLVALHGTEIVPVSVLGLNAGRETHGHRFEAANDPIVLRDADSYAAQLETEGAVIAEFDKRRDQIAQQLKAAAAQAGTDLTPIDDSALLDEVTALVERPNVLVGQFEAAFLDVPQECLILTMKANQKYFPLLDAAGRLANKFLIVSNIRPADTSAVVGGNERVVRPRLADAKFFFDQDRKKTLASRVPGLARIVYHNKLGTQGERTERVGAIARAIGAQLGGDALAEQASAAAHLAKADLLTDMVGEFPELQGIMGAYYARHDGIPGDIADAIEDHYKPRFAGDELPRGTVGLVVALADKLETLAGLFGIGQTPTGDKDPFALRRHALGVIRMLIERELPLSLTGLVNEACIAFPNAGEAHLALNHFLRERLIGYLRDAGYSAQEVDAVVEARPDRWHQFPTRLAAVRAFAALPEAASLAAANKRVGNILKKAASAVAPAVDANRLVEPAEIALAKALDEIGPAAGRAFDAGDYTGSLKALAALHQPVDAFFDKVMVNADDPLLRANRLGLLAMLHAAMNRVADLSRLAS